MKKILLTAAALSAFSTSVYATKARILSLGDEVEDNYFTMDDRYIFTNASYANEYADMVMLEWGDDGAGSGGASLDQDSDAKAMGGFLTKSGDFVYGAYLGNESNVSSFLRILASNGAGQYLQTSDNQVDLFIAGGQGVKWGANFLYSKSKDERDASDNAEDSAMALRLGAHTDKWEGFANISLKSESEDKNQTNSPKFEGKLGFQLGGSYTMGTMKYHAAIKKFDWEQTLSGTKTDGGFTRIDLGAGHTHKINATDSVFVRTQFTKLDVELDYTAGKAELNNTVLPVIIGYEGKATSWLVLRGSISHNIIGTAESKNLSSIPLAGTGGSLQNLALASYNGSTTDGETTIANSTTVNAGASFIFGKLTIDGFVGTTAASRAATTQAKQGVLSTDNLLTRVGMTYSF